MRGDDHMWSKELKSIIDHDKTRNKENKRTRLYLNILRREKFYGGRKSIHLFEICDL